MNESVDLSLLSYEEEIEKAINYYVSELGVIRVGRANPKILDKVVVDYYGTLTPINQMANISVPEARMMLISVWDISKTPVGISPPWPINKLNTCLQQGQIISICCIMIYLLFLFFC